MRYALTSSFYQSHNHLLQPIGMGEDVIQTGDFELLFLLCFIEQRDVFLAAVEVDAANGFAVVVVRADTWVGTYLKYSSSCQLAALLRM